MKSYLIKYIMEKIKFCGLPFDYEYAGRVFYIIKYSRVFGNKRIINLLYGYAKTDSGIEYICLVGDEFKNCILDCLISCSYVKALDMYLHSLEKYA